MRRLFNERARLVVYLEAEDLNRLTAKARESGATLVEWARERLQSEVKDEKTRRGADRVRRTVRVDVGPSTTASSDDSGRVAEALPGQGKTCPHKKVQGEVCYKCDPKFGYPEVA